MRLGHTPRLRFLPKLRCERFDSHRLQSHLRQIDAAQLPQPLGPCFRSVALPLLRNAPPLSLALSRTFVTLLALALLATSASAATHSPPSPLLFLFTAPAALLAAAAAYSSRRLPLRLWRLDVGTALARLSAHPPQGYTPPGGSEATLSCRGFNPEADAPNAPLPPLSLETLADLLGPTNPPLDTSELVDAMVSLDLDRDGFVSDADLVAWAGGQIPLAAGGM